MIDGLLSIPAAMSTYKCCCCGIRMQGVVAGVVERKLGTCWQARCMSYRIGQLLTYEQSAKTLYLALANGDAETVQSVHDQIRQAGLYYCWPGGAA